MIAINKLKLIYERGMGALQLEGLLEDGSDEQKKRISNSLKRTLRFLNLRNSVVSPRGPTSRPDWPATPGVYQRFVVCPTAMIFTIPIR